ncbi:MAG: GDSL-type esterase/lipase family protein [Planctomycetota bacterium]
MLATATADDEDLHESLRVAEHGSPRNGLLPVRAAEAGTPLAAGSASRPAARPSRRVASPARLLIVPGMSRRLRLAILVTGSVVAGLLLAELVVRVFLPQPQSWMNIYRSHPSQPMFAVAAHVDEVADTGETRWHVRTDHEGLRLRSDGARAGGDGPQIVLLGDSFTFGYGVDCEQSFAGLLEQRLSPRARVVNAGQPGYGPKQELMMMQHLLSVGVEPAHVVLVIYAGNDVLDAILPTDRPVRDGSIDEPPGWRERLQQHSHLYRVAARAYHRWFKRTPHFIHDWRELMRPATWQESDLRVGMDNMRAALAELRDLCRSKHASLHAVVLPPAAAVDACGHRPNANDPTLQYELPVRMMMSLLADLEVPAHDLTPALAPLGSSGAFLPFDGHLSPAGHAAVAEAMQAAIDVLRS